MGLKLKLGGSDGVCDIDTLGLRLLRKILRQEVPSLGLMIEYTLGTWVGKSLA